MKGITKTPAAKSISIMPPKAIKSSQLPTSKKRTTTTKDFGGGNQYNQMNLMPGFELVKPRPGHSQKSNLKTS